jgi:hypothetical protein
LANLVTNVSRVKTKPITECFNTLTIKLQLNNIKLEEVGIHGAGAFDGYMCMGPHFTNFAIWIHSIKRYKYQVVSQYFRNQTTKHMQLLNIIILTLTTSQVASMPRPRVCPLGTKAADCTFPPPALTGELFKPSGQANSKPYDWSSVSNPTPTKAQASEAKQINQNLADRASSLWYQFKNHFKAQSHPTTSATAVNQAASTVAVPAGFKPRTPSHRRGRGLQM